MLTLIATDLPRFMTCNGSTLMPQHVPFNVDDTIRNEGNAAHWLIEQVHKRRHTVDELVERKAFNGVFITEEMVEHVTPFLQAIEGKGEVECDTSYGDGQRYQINGRADHIWHDNGSMLYISDFKYGWSIVEPEKNWTLLSHAFGWLFANRNIPVDNVTLQIFQPRPHHPVGKIRQITLHINEIWQAWAQLEASLINPTNNLQTSAHCKDCPALASCPAAQKAGMNAIDVSETAFVSEIDDQTLGFLLDQIERATKVLEGNGKAYRELALHRLKAGKIIPGYGTEKDLTNKQWKEGISIETAQMLTGKDLSKKQLITPAQAVKAGVPENLIDSLCERREKGVKLARLDANTAVKKMFKNLQ